MEVVEDAFQLHQHGDMFVGADDSCGNTTDIPRHTAITTILSSVASMIGSFLIIFTFLLWKDVRTVARAILVFLAIADFFTAAGYLFGSIVFLSYNSTIEDSPSTEDSLSYTRLCIAQSFITTVFPISSFLWTTHLAIYLFVTIVLHKINLAKKLFVIFHLTAWGIPLLVCLPAAITKHLGPSNHYTSTAWCFVEFNGTLTGSETESEVSRRLAEFYGFEFLCGKFWEIMAYIVALTLYVSVKISLWWRRRHKVLTDSISYGSLTMEERVTAAIIQLDQKLIWIPLVFILLRMWGTIRFFISFSPDCRFPNKQCHMIVANTSCTDILYNPVLVYLQSIGDPGQGWGNALLFVVFNKVIAKRLCPCVFTLARKVQKRLKRYRKEEKGSDDSQKKGSSAIASERDHLLRFNATDMDSSPIMYSGSQLPKKCVTVQNQTCTSPEASINVTES